MKKQSLMLATLRKVALATATVAALFSFTGCKDDEGATPKSITDVVIEDPNFTILEAAVTRAGLADALRTGTLTVFAPTDAAFRAAGIADAAAVTALDANTVKTILQYHVLNSRVAAADIPATASNQATATLGGGTIYVTKSGNNVFINGAQVTQADIQAANGIVHVINQLLLPPPAAQQGNILGVIASQSNMTILTAAIAKIAAIPANAALATQLTTQLFTVFAPTDAAFQTTPFNSVAAVNNATGSQLTTLQNILLNHVLQGRIYSNSLASGDVTTASLSKVTVNVGTNGINVKSAGITTPANVTRANLTGTNGVVHVIDRVLIP